MATRSSSSRPTRCVARLSLGLSPSRYVYACRFPAGQTLAAMLVGQTLNEQPIPIYGCYIVGHVWRFMVLEGKNYTISREFLSTTDDLMNIFGVLKSLKIIIMELTD